MSDRGFVVAVVTTAAVFALFALEVAYQRRLERRRAEEELRAAVRACVAILAPAFEQLGRVMVEQVVPVLQAATVAIAEFAAAFADALDPEFREELERLTTEGGDQ